MNYKPLKDNLLVELDCSENTTESGLIVDKESFDDRGVVIAAGPYVSEVLVGERVVFKTDGIERLEIGGKKCAMMVEEDVLAVIEE